MPRHLAAFLPSLRAIDRIRVTRPEPFANQAQYPRINDPVPDKLHQPFVVDGIEKVSQIRIHNPPRANLDSSPNFAQGVLGRSPSPTAKAGIIEYQFEDRLQPAQQRLPAPAIVNRWNTQARRQKQTRNPLIHR